MVVREADDDLGLERSLVAAARIGDPVAFESLVEPHRRGLHLHCYRMTGSLTDADDMLQESLLKAWRRIDTFENRAPFRGCSTRSLPILASTSWPRVDDPDSWRRGNGREVPRHWQRSNTSSLTQIAFWTTQVIRQLASTRRRASRSPSSL